MENHDVNLLTGHSLGWAASLLASFTWSFSVLMFRTYCVGRSPTWLNLFKGCVALLFFGVTAIFSGLSIGASSLVFWTLAASGVIGVFIGDSAFFSALIRVGGTMTAAIQSLAPCLTAVLAWIFLDEVLSKLQILGLVLTSISLLILVIRQSPSWGSVSRSTHDTSKNSYFIGVIYASVAAVCQAAGAVIAKPVISEVSPITSAALRLWAPVLLLFFWQVRKNRGILLTFQGLVSGSGILPMALASFAGTFLGLILMMYGMANAPLGVALALTSSYPIWIMAIEQLSGKSQIGKFGFLLVILSVAGIWLMI